MERVLRVRAGAVFDMDQVESGRGAPFWASAAIVGSGADGRLQAGDERDGAGRRAQRRRALGRISRRAA